MQFDAVQFMNATVAEANATKIPNIPAGEYIGQIEPVTPDSFESGVAGPNAKEPGKPYTRFIYKVKITNDSLVPALGRNVATVRGDFFLDLTESGAIKMGEGVNVSLGRLRQATGLNIPGQPFSFPMLSGKMVKIMVGHRADPRDANTIYDEIKSITSAF